MNYWLMKSEPESYSIADLERDGTTLWNGVRNYQVRNMMRDEIKIGDRALFYHSSAGKNTGVVGIMKVVGEAEPDLSQFNSQSQYYDPASPANDPRWLAVKMSHDTTFVNPISLSKLKLDPFFADMRLLQRGNRLSIMPVNKKHFERICKLGRG